MSHCRTSKSLEQFRFGLGDEHKEATDRLSHIEPLTHGKDADALHQDLRNSVQSTADMFAVMQKLAALPDDFTAELVTPLLLALDEATTRMDTDMQALSDAQDAFAKANHIQVQSTG